MQRLGSGIITSGAMEQTQSHCTKGFPLRDGRSFGRWRWRKSARRLSPRGSTETLPARVRPLRPAQGSGEEAKTGTAEGLAAGAVLNSPMMSGLIPAQPAVDLVAQTGCKAGWAAGRGRRRDYAEKTGRNALTRGGNGVEAYRQFAQGAVLISPRFLPVGAGR